MKKSSAKNSHSTMLGYVDDQLEIFETHVLKVHINCEGCELKVRKLLNKIEGVYTVTVDREQDLVMVSGSVDSATLVKKLAKSGKVAEVWLPNPESNWNQGQDELHQIQDNDLDLIPYQYKFPAYFGNENGDIEIIENFSNLNFGMKAVDPGVDHGIMAEPMMKNFYDFPTVEEGMEDRHTLCSLIINDMHMTTSLVKPCNVHDFFPW